MSTPATREAYVYLHLPQSLEVVTCGQYRRHVTAQGVVGEFRYAPMYLDPGPRAGFTPVPLDPIALRLGGGWFVFNGRGGLPGVLADAGPDGWGQKVIRQRGRAREPDELDFLLDAPEDRVGALSVGTGREPPAPQAAFNARVTLEELRAAARAIEMGDATAAQHAAQLLLEPTSSLLGGARPKATLEDEGRLWLAKFPARGDTWSCASVEGAMLRLAARCGIRVPECRIVRLQDEKVLLIERFDRTATAGGWFRHRYASALTLLGLEESDRSQWSYLSLADELRRWGVPTSERQELFRRMVFNACISNTDDHPKNHAVHAASADWHLTPAYDLVPAPSVSIERDLAMQCGPSGRAARRANLIAGAPQFGLSLPEAGAIVAAIEGTVRTRWRAEILAMEGDDADCTAIASAILPEGFEFPMAP